MKVWRAEGLPSFSIPAGSTGWRRMQNRQRVIDKLKTSCRVRVTETNLVEVSATRDSRKRKNLLDTCEEVVVRPLVEDCAALAAFNPTFTIFSASSPLCPSATQPVQVAVED